MQKEDRIKLYIEKRTVYDTNCLRKNTTELNKGKTHLEKVQIKTVWLDFKIIQQLSNHWLKFCNKINNLSKHHPMIIKLPLPTILYARHKIVKVVSPLTLKDRVNADRIAIVISYLVAITAAVIFS
ncbi:hypothetical protein [Pedobacter boryungensis]|nr:hypothetical protein [Pedobacter boryungensis]